MLLDQIKRNSSDLLQSALLKLVVQVLDSNGGMQRRATKCGISEEGQRQIAAILAVDLNWLAFFEPH